VTSVVIVITIVGVPRVFKCLLTAILFVVFLRATGPTDASPRVLIFGFRLKGIPSAARGLSLYRLLARGGASKPLTPEAVKMCIFSNEILGLKTCEWLVFAEKRALKVKSCRSHGEVPHYRFGSRGKSS